MSPLPDLFGHDAARRALGRAVRTGRLPGSVLLHGPAGTGRQRTALWLAQLLVCESPGDEPCDVCRNCRLARRLEHPDVHWFFPLPRPKGASSPEKLQEALEDARAAELESRRDAPLRPTLVGEPVGLYLAQVQTIRRLAASRPSMGHRQIFIVGDAELLVPQESSPEAANALLKVLEEPPEGTFFVLTASDPDALLPTIRSRLLPVRIGALPEADVEAFLTNAAGADPSTARLAAHLAQGSIGRALGYLPQDGEPGPLEDVRQRARRLLSSALASGSAHRFAAAHGETPAGARGVFRDVLESLEVWCRDVAAVTEGAEDHVVNVDSIDDLRTAARLAPAAGSLLSDGVDLIEEARTLASGNVNPQLILARLLRRLGETLRSVEAAES